MSSTRRRWCLAGIAVLLAFPMTTQAASKVAVLGVEPVDAPVKLAARFSAALKEHVKRAAGYELVPGKAIEEVKLVFGCGRESAACMAKVGESLKAERLFWGGLRKVNGGYSLKLVVLAVGTKSVERQLQARFSKSELGTLESRVLTLARKLLPPQGASLRLRCNEEGAVAYVDGRKVGYIAAGRLHIDGLAPGPHAVRLGKAGFSVWHQRVVLKAGGVRSITAELKASDGPAPVPANGLGQGGLALGDPITSKPATGGLGWKVAFYSSVVATAGVTVGLVLNGLKVLDLEDRKDVLMRGLADPTDPNNNKLYGGDACDAVKGIDRYAPVADVCRSGDTHAVVQNVLIGVIALTAGVSAYLGYRAFIADNEERRSREDDTTPLDSALTRRDQPDSTRAAKGRRSASAGWSLQFSPGMEGAHVGVRLRF